MSNITRDQKILESLALNEAYTKPKINPGTKYVMLYNGDVVMQFNSKQSMDQYKYNIGRNPNGVMGEFKKVVNGAIVPLGKGE